MSSMTDRRRSPPPLSGLIVSRVSRGTALALFLLTTLVGWFFHRQLHNQTDAVLMALAASESRASHDDEHHDKEQNHKYSSRSTFVSLPWGDSAEVETTRAILSITCQLLSHSEGFSPQLTAAQCEGKDQVFFLHRDDGVELRVARYRDHTKQVIVGIEHAPLDAALWRSVALCALASLLTWLAIWLITRRVVKALTVDLVELELACRELDLNAPFNGLVFSVGERMNDTKSAREVITLAETLGAMLSRLQESVSRQRRFIAEAAHELRTPLTALRGEIEVTLRRSRSVEEYQETLGYLANDVDRLSSLSDQLLSAASGQNRVLQLDEIDLISTINDALESLNVTLENAEEKPRFRLNTSQHKVLVLGERDASLRALINILQNAKIHSRAQVVTLSFREESHYTILSIEDDGIGISQELFPYLLTPFVKGETSHGHGLGLSICADLMQAQGGELRMIDQSASQNIKPMGMKLSLCWQTRH